MVTDQARELFKEYTEEQCEIDSYSIWDFGDKILYDLCSNYPLHKEPGVIAAKIWLIGRSYAAAIERRRLGLYDGTDFYRDVVSPKMQEVGDELDLRLKRLNDSTNTVIDDLDEILGLHKFLTDAFKEISDKEKRSLASKYLHFHCPNRFFIYDSRANKAATHLAKRPDKHRLALCKNTYDNEYATFVCRALELRKALKVEAADYLSPRALDRFLLSDIVQTHLNNR